MSATLTNSISIIVLGVATIVNTIAIAKIARRQ